MTVSELIEILKELPQELEVRVQDITGEFTEPVPDVRQDRRETWVWL